MAEENAAQVTDAVSTLNNMNFLMKSPAWKQVVEVLYDKYNPQLNSVLYEPRKPDEAYAYEFLRGELKAWTFFVNLPQDMATASQDVLDMIKAQAEGEDNGESS